MPAINTTTFKATKDRIAALAMDAFAGHVLRREGDGRWLCRTPDESAYWFRVIIAPGAVIVLGDLGELVLRLHDARDPVAWLRGSVNSVDYLLEKVQASKEPPKDFYPVDALAWLERDITDSLEADPSADVSDLRDELAELGRSHSSGDLDRRTFLDACERLEYDDVWDVGMYPSSNMLWMIELLRCFVRLEAATHEPEQAAAS